MSNTYSKKWKSRLLWFWALLVCLVMSALAHYFYMSYKCSKYVKDVEVGDLPYDIVSVSLWPDYWEDIGRFSYIRINISSRRPVLDENHSFFFSVTGRHLDTGDIPLVEKEKWRAKGAESKN